MRDIGKLTKEETLRILDNLEEGSMILVQPPRIVDEEVCEANSFGGGLVYAGKQNGMAGMEEHYEFVIAQLRFGAGSKIVYRTMDISDVLRSSKYLGNVCIEGTLRSWSCDEGTEHYKRLEQILEKARTNAQSVREVAQIK